LQKIKHSTFSPCVCMFCVTVALQNLANSDQETLKSAAAGCLWTVQQQKDDNPKISEASNLGMT